MVTVPGCHEWCDLQASGISDHGCCLPCSMDVFKHLIETVGDDLPVKASLFAAGNLVHAAETADVAALSGRHAAGMLP
jgi:hypothetical protein